MSNIDLVMSLSLQIQGWNELQDRCFALSVDMISLTL